MNFPYRKRRKSGQLDVKTLLEHLVELEQHLGSLDAFKFYEVSSGFVHYNEISVAYEAERMLKHTGLLGYKVSIEFTTLNDNAAGCVAMNHAKEFTIKINQDKKYIDESVLGIVAHEI